MTGHLIARHREIFSRNPLFIGMRLPEARELEPLERRYPRLTPAAMDIIKVCLCISLSSDSQVVQKMLYAFPLLLSPSFHFPVFFLPSTCSCPLLTLLTHATVVTKVRPKWQTNMLTTFETWAVHKEWMVRQICVWTESKDWKGVWR